MKELPDLTNFSRDSLITLVHILHDDNQKLERDYDEAMRLLRGVSRPAPVPASKQP